jgi:hypothetical protein
VTPGNVSDMDEADQINILAQLGDEIARGDLFVENFT